MNPTTSPMFRLNLTDIQKGLIMAVLGGALLPLDAIIQSPNFDIFHANILALASLAANGALIAFVSYLVKNFFSSDGKVLGRIG